MHVTVKELMASPRAWLKLCSRRTDRYPWLFSILRGGVLLCVAALLQAWYFQLSMPSLDSMESTRAHTRLVRTLNPRIYTLEVMVGAHRVPLGGACSGFQRSESNFTGDEDVRVWQHNGKVWQLTNLAGEVYRPATDAMPCSLTNTLEWADRRPELAGWLALLGVLVALGAWWRISALYGRELASASGAGSQA